MVGVAVFLSKRKSQHFAYGKILAQIHILVVEGRMYKVLRLYLHLRKGQKQVIIYGTPFTRSMAKALHLIPQKHPSKATNVQKPALEKRAGYA